MMTVQNLRQHGRNTLICQRIHNERNSKSSTKKEGRPEDFVLAKDIKVIYMVRDSPQIWSTRKKGGERTRFIYVLARVTTWSAAAMSSANWNSMLLMDCSSLNTHSCGPIVHNILMYWWRKPTTSNTCSTYVHQPNRKTTIYGSTTVLLSIC